MVSQEVIDKLKKLREKEQPDTSDALTLFKLFQQIAEEEEEIQEELEDLDEIVIQNSYSDEDFKYWVKLGEGKFEVGEGEAEEPSVTMEAKAETWAGLGNGDLDATSAYMAGDLEIEGNLQDAIAYGEVLDLIREIIDESEE